MDRIFSEQIGEYFIFLSICEEVRERESPFFFSSSWRCVCADNTSLKKKLIILHSYRRNDHRRRRSQRGPCSDGPH